MRFLPVRLFCHIRAVPPVLAEDCLAVRSRGCGVCWRVGCSSLGSESNRLSLLPEALRPSSLSNICEFLWQTRHDCFTSSSLRPSLRRQRFACDRLRSRDSAVNYKTQGPPQTLSPRGKPTPSSRTAPGTEIEMATLCTTRLTEERYDHPNSSLAWKESHH